MKRLLSGIIIMTAIIHVRADPWIRFSGSGSFEPERSACERVISFSNGISFDTRKGEPHIPAGYRAAPVRAGETGAYLVQCSGPVNQEWVGSLTRTGALVIAYYPSNSFLVRMNDAALSQVKDLPFVVWTGMFHPAYKVVESSLFDRSGSGGLVLLLFPDADIAEAVKTVQQYGGVVADHMVSGFAKTITIKAIDYSRISALANVPQVMALHTRDKTSLANTDAQWVLQQGWHENMTCPDATDINARPVWRRGLTGRGIILGYHDTGINFNIGTPPDNGHNLFRDPAVPITKEGEYPDHRKVVAYRVYPDALYGDVDMLTKYHGTHTGGSIAGNDTIANGSGPDTADGIAKDARLCFVDICNGAAQITVPDDMTDFNDLVMKSSAAGEILQHSGSWGSYTDEHVCDYRIRDAAHDAWHWENKLVLAIWAAGNHGLTARTIFHPAVAKNVLSIGGCCNALDAYKSMRVSSRGPTQDGRIKPTIVTPGWEIKSAWGGTIDKYTRLSGTSMATPLANGAMGLIRQYFQDGWYPLGKPRKQNAFIPSAALMRAMAVCSADSGFVLDILDRKFMPPDSNVGFGRLTLDSVLYFDTLGTDNKNLGIVDYRNGVATGQYVEFTAHVRDGSNPLRVVLAWQDTAAAVGANPTLVNDLNLEVTAPGGTTYRGNQMSNWSSTPDPQQWDDRNVEEMVRVFNPQPGAWKIRVRGQNMPNGQNVWFGLAVTGALDFQTGSGDTPFKKHTTPDCVLGAATPNPCFGRTTISYTLRTPGFVSLTVYNSAGRLIRTLINEKVPAGKRSILWNGCDAAGKKAPAGLYFYEIRLGKEPVFRAVNKVIIL